MHIETATDAKNRFGQIMDAALREPVVIQRSGRNSVVMIAYEDFEQLIAMADKNWGEKAKKSAKKGFLSASASERLIERLLHAKD